MALMLLLAAVLPNQVASVLQAPRLASAPIFPGRRTQTRTGNTSECRPHFRSIGDAAGADCLFTLQLDLPSQVNISTCANEIDTVLYLFGGSTHDITADTAPMLANDDAGARPQRHRGCHYASSSIGVELDAGTYTVAVEGFDETVRGGFDLTIDVRQEPRYLRDTLAAAPVIRHSDCDGGAAVELHGNTSEGGHLFTTTGADSRDVVYRLELNAVHQVTLCTCNNEVDTVLYLFGGGHWADVADAHPLHLNDDHVRWEDRHTSACSHGASRMVATLLAGSYYVVVESFDGDHVGGFDLTVQMERLLPSTFHEALEWAPAFDPAHDDAVWSASASGKAAPTWSEMFHGNVSQGILERTSGEVAVRRDPLYRVELTQPHVARYRLSLKVCSDEPVRLVLHQHQKDHGRQQLVASGASTALSDDEGFAADSALLASPDGLPGTVHWRQHSAVSAGSCTGAVSAIATSVPSGVYYAVLEPVGLENADDVDNAFTLQIMVAPDSDNDVRHSTDHSVVTTTAVSTDLDLDDGSGSGDGIGADDAFGTAAEPTDSAMQPQTSNQEPAATTVDTTTADTTAIETTTVETAPTGGGSTATLGTGSNHDAPSTTLTTATDIATAPDAVVTATDAAHTASDMVVTATAQTPIVIVTDPDHLTHHPGLIVEPDSAANNDDDGGDRRGRTALEIAAVACGIALLVVTVGAVARYMMVRRRQSFLNPGAGGGRKQSKQHRHTPSFANAAYSRGPDVPAVNPLAYGNPWDDSFDERSDDPAHMSLERNTLAANVSRLSSSDPEHDWSECQNVLLVDENDFEVEMLGGVHNTAV